jgi:hypothetical protein
LSSDNEEVGKITEIMLDVERSQIAYAVMSSGGLLGIGNKLMALPWNALTLDTTRKCFVLNATSDRIRYAPGFDKGEWPAMADIEFARTLHDYYGTRAYCESVRVTQSGETQSPEPPEAGGVNL